MTENKLSIADLNTLKTTTEAELATAYESGDITALKNTAIKLVGIDKDINNAIATEKSMVISNYCIDLRNRLLAVITPEDSAKIKELGGNHIDFLARWFDGGPITANVFILPTGGKVTATEPKVSGKHNTHRHWNVLEPLFGRLPAVAVDTTHIPTAGMTWSQYRETDKDGNFRYNVLEAVDKL